MRANRYVSYLGAEIEPKAIATLNQFEQATERTFERINAMSAKASSRTGLGGMDGRTISTARMAEQALARAQQRIRETGQASERTAAQTSRMATSFTRASQALGVVQGPLGPLAGRLSALGSIFERLSGFNLAGVIAGGGAFALGSIATQYQKVTDRLRPFYDTQTELNSALKDVVGIARDTRSALDPVAQLYARLTQAGKDVGIVDPSRIRRLTETVAKAARLSGGDEASQKAGIGQFMQAFGSNQLGGDELRAIKEDTYRLAKAIADGLGVSVGALKQLGKEGRLTTEVVAQALERSADKIDAEFSRIPPRIGSSLTALSNNFSVFVGRIDETTGATSFLANALLLIANNLDKVAAAATIALAAFSANTVVATFRAATGAVTGFVGAGVKAVQSELQLAAAINEGRAVVLGSAEAVKQKAGFVAIAAREELAAVEEVVAARQADQAQLRAQLPLINAQIAAQARQLEMARLLDAASRAQYGRQSTDTVRVATEELNASMRARLATEEALIQVNRNLAVAEEQLAVATGAAAAAEVELTAAMAAAPAVVARTTVAMTVARTALAGLSAAGSGLLTLLGGWWGVAFLAAAGATVYLMSRTNEAKSAIDNFRGGQEALAERLGITTAKLQEQSAAARQLAIDLAEAGVQEAKKKARDVGEELGSTLEAAAVRAGGKRKAFTRPLMPGDPGYDQTDSARLREIAERARQGKFNFQQDYPVITDIRKRNPNAFGQGNILDRLLGQNPANFAEKVKGASAAIFELEDAESNLAETRKKANAPAVKAGNILPPKALTQDQLNAAAQAQAARTELQKARANVAEIVAGGKQEGETDQQYIDRLAAAKSQVQSLMDAESARKKGLADARRAQAAYNKELRAQETARDKAMGLENLMDRFSLDTPIKRLRSLQAEAAAAKRKIDDLVGERVAGYGVFSEKDAAAQKGKIDAYVAQEARRPLTDMLSDMRAENDQQAMVNAGRADQAALMERIAQLQKTMAGLTEDDAQALADEITKAHQLNDAYERRTQLLEIHARLIGAARDATRELIRSTLDDPMKAFGNIGSFAKRLRQAWLDAKADELTLKLIGDPEKKFRDEMNRGLMDAGEALKSSSGNLDGSATNLDAAADALTAAAEGRGLGSPVAAALGGDSPVGAGLSNLDYLDQVVGSLGDASATLATAGKAAGDALTDGGDAIIVTGKRLKTQELGTVSERFNKIGADLGKMIFGSKGLGKLAGDKSNVQEKALGKVASLAQKAFSKLGDFMEGTVYGQIGGGISQKLLGGKGSKLGSQIGGGLGEVLGKDVLGPMLGKLGSFAGPLGAIAGGVLGSVVGGLLKKSKTGSATISNLSGNYGMSGNDSASKAAATGAADSVTSGIQRIAEQLGGTIGSFSVSIGQKDGKWRVDPTGRGNVKVKKGAIDYGQDQEAATRAAILDAIKDGAVQGIRDGAKRLLQAGRDLDTALDKALKFQDVFRKLKSYTDPVGAAVDDVNTRFQELIRIFTEAGASASEWADLEKLYGYERADAIKQATSETVSALQDWITSVTAGPDSPLSKKTVYANAKAALDAFRGDIAAKKPVDQDALVKAMEDFQAASQALNGSRPGFFQDFNDLLALANQAKGNAADAAAAGATNPSALPPSPFDAMRPTLDAQLNESRSQTQLLQDIRDGVAQLNSGGGGGGYGSTIDYLPSYGGLSNLGYNYS